MIEPTSVLIEGRTRPAGWIRIGIWVGGLDGRGRRRNTRVRGDHRGGPGISRRVHRDHRLLGGRRTWRCNDNVRRRLRGLRWVIQGTCVPRVGRAASAGNERDSQTEPDASGIARGSARAAWSRRVGAEVRHLATATREAGGPLQFKAAAPAVVGAARSRAPQGRKGRQQSMPAIAVGSRSCSAQGQTTRRLNSPPCDSSGRRANPGGASRERLARRNRGRPSTIPPPYPQPRGESAAPSRASSVRDNPRSHCFRHAELGRCRSHGRGTTCNCRPIRWRSRAGCPAHSRRSPGHPRRVPTQAARAMPFASNKGDYAFRS